MKKIKLILFAALALLLVPSIAYADTITVKLKTNPSNADSLVELSVPEGTTVATIRTLLAAEVDMEKYILLNNWNQNPDDNAVVCIDSSLSCYGPDDGKFTTMLLMEKDTTEKKYTLKSIPPKDEMMLYSIIETNWEMFEPLFLDSCDETFTTCTFKENHPNFKAYTNVKLTWDYDAEIAKIAQKAVDEGLLNNNEFEATDTELLNYIMYGGSLANYTSSFKNQLSNLNFVSSIDQRGGAFEPFNTAEIGFYRAEYNGTLYAIKDFIEINAPHIIYVPDDATDKVKAVKARLKDLFGNDASMIEVEESTETINELLISEGEDSVGEIGNNTFVILTVNNPDSPMSGRMYNFAVFKDSSKINNTIDFKSSDLLTNVSVETAESIPLDTIVGVTQIASGETYDKIIGILDVEEGEMFDISLTSISQKKSITKLANGKFLVRIPIPEKYNGKSLIVYYVDESNIVTPYEVTAKDGYASFETDHFSTYTLTIDKNAKEPVNPPTGDKVFIYIILLGVSTVGLVGIPVYIKNRK